MIPELAVGEFSEYFREMHGNSPFPWQNQLARYLVEKQHWPRVLDLPTGFGKTAALDLAVFHLALEVDRGRDRRTPVRIAFIVDRRLVVDDAFARAQKIEFALRTAQQSTVIWKVAERLRLLAGNDEAPLLARRLRGGIPREDDWARTPVQPTILCSTVDQVGSRLLFRGYGISDSMKPVHAGLMGADCLLLLDEAHLSEPFRQTLNWVDGYRSERWREDKFAAPWGVALLTATPGTATEDVFRPTDEDYAHSILKRRWEVPKPARLIDLAKIKKMKRESNLVDETDTLEGQESGQASENRRVNELVQQASAAYKALIEAGLPIHPAIAVIVNRVARARAVFESLKRHLNTENGEDGVEILLMIGPARPVDRGDLARELDSIRTGSERKLKKPLVIVATQCIEAGVDIDLDGLITEAAPLDALLQRFGRLNRDGRKIAPYAAIIGDSKADKEDPVYEESIKTTWHLLTENRNNDVGHKPSPHVDFGLREFKERMPYPFPVEVLAPKLDAPVLLPAHLDLLSQTSPIPIADPEVSLYLHGPNRTADDVTVVWREDVDGERHSDVETRRLLMLVPPRSGEVIELPVWAVRKWLVTPKADFSELTDIPGSPPENSEGNGKRRVFWWAGDDERSRWIEAAEIRPGCTIVVPTRYGGVDEYGWDPHSTEPALDVAERAAEPFEHRRFAVRIAPQLFETDEAKDKLAAAIAGSSSGGWKDLRDDVSEVVHSEIEKLRNTSLENGGAAVSTRLRRLEAVASALRKLDNANASRQRRARVQTYPDAYGLDQDQRPRGVVFVALLGIKTKALTEETNGADSPSATEDDLAGSLPGYAQPLKQHSEAVEFVVDQHRATARPGRAGAAGRNDSRLGPGRVARSGQFLGLGVDNLR